jgi:hypothetical protein
MKCIHLNVLIMSIVLSFQSANAVDVILSPNCFSTDESKTKELCFGFMKELFQEGELWVIFGLPIFFLSENAPSNINTAQLTEMGYTAEEIADLRKDIKALQSAMAQRKTPFNSALEMKAWMQSFPLAPITLELMRAK